MANDDEIFHHLTAPVENVEEYRLGGYHPLHPKDSLLNGRYLVLRKLGHGSYSTTWLTHDRKYVLLHRLQYTKTSANLGPKGFQICSNQDQESEVLCP